MNDYIAIIDDHPLISMGLGCSLIENGYNVSIMKGSFGSMFQDIVLIKPSFIFLDIHMLNINAIKLLRMITVLLPETKVIAMTAAGNVESLQMSKDEGASAFVHKSASPCVFINALKSISCGEDFFSYNVSGQYDKIESLEYQKNNHNLTVRETETLNLLSQGHSILTISQMMAVSNKTVSTYKANILRKLNVPNVLAAIDIARGSYVVA